MSRKRTISAVAGLLCLASGVAALPQSADERVRAFADCAGRYSAEVEHVWLMGGPARDEIMQRRELFAELVQASLPMAEESGITGRQIIAWRVEAKLAHAALLQSATFAGDDAVSDRADRAARGFVTQCDRLILGA
ncbi:hypothetical protein [Pseudaestuariivita atlantica]|uniref:hypothetical protein n=1 Tax=Pseudaestuariivita atlantica TaxID=1317121 RepID=UPI00067E498F|nr:hypothetical protein [Pseudaestuariivita atlantica]